MLVDKKTMNKNLNENNGLKIFVIFIGMLLWFPLTYYSFVFANWQTHFFIESNLLIKGVILFCIILIWISGIHKVVYSMFFVTLNHKYGDLLYSLTGISATLLAYYFYLNKHPIFYDSSYSLALLSTTSETLISKSLSLSIYISLIVIFTCNYCFFPVFNRKK